MTQMTTIDGALCRNARKCIDEALKELGEELGVKFSAGNASYAADGKSGHFKLEMVTLDGSGEALDMDAENFKLYALRYALSPNDLGKKINIYGGSYEIAGLRPKARKNQILLRNSSGKDYVAPAEDVRRALDSLALSAEK